MPFVFRSKRRVNGKVRVSRTYTGQFRLAGDSKATRVSLGVSDKQVAEERLRRIVREAEREREGWSLPKEQREARKRSIEKLRAGYVESKRGLKSR